MQASLQPTIIDLLHDATLLLHFIEYAKAQGHPKLGAAAYAAAALECISDAKLQDEHRLKKIELCEVFTDLFQEFLVSPQGLATSGQPRTDTRQSHSTHVQQRLREYAGASGTHVGEEHEMYAFALSMIRGVRLSNDMQKRLEIAIAEIYELEQSRDKALKHCLECWCGPLVDIPIVQSNSLRSFEISDVVGDVRVTFEDAAPGLFKRIRDLSDVSHSQYLHSMLREDVELISFGTNSKSGEFFFFSHDGLFMVKTVSDKSARKLIDMLPAYEKHLDEFPDSFLVRYLGLHRIRFTKPKRRSFTFFDEEGLSSRSPKNFSKESSAMRSMPERWFVIMRSAFYTSLEMHEKYDLKGSQWGRRAKPGDAERGAPLLDLDWNDSRFRPLFFSPENEVDVINQYEADSAFLQSFDLVDYSILMGIHDRTYSPSKRAKAAALSRRHSVKLQQRLGGDGECGFRTTSLNRVRSMGGHQVPGGVDSSAGAQVVVFCLIDTLEPYDLTRKLQHGVGGLVTGILSAATNAPCEQAIVDPESYRRRQLSFFKEIVCPQNSETVKCDEMQTLDAFFG